MISNLSNYSKFDLLEINEKKQMVNAILERDIDNELKRKYIRFSKSLNVREKLVLLSEKCPESPLFKTISEDLIKVMSMMQNKEITIKKAKKEDVPFVLQGKVTHYCSRLNIFPMYIYNVDNELVKLEIVNGIKYTNMAISLFDCFNNRFLEKIDNKVKVLK